MDYLTDEQKKRLVKAIRLSNALLFRLMRTILVLNRSVYCETLWLRLFWQNFKTDFNICCHTFHY